MSTIQQKLHEIQKELKAPKELNNSFGQYNYRSCEGILEVLKPLVFKADCVLTLTDEIVSVSGLNYVKSTALLSDFKGEHVYSEAYAKEALKQGAMSPPQLTGSSSSYARKYALCGLFAIDDNASEDPDALKPEVKKEPVNMEGAKKALKEGKATIQSIKQHRKISPEQLAELEKSVVK